MDAMVSEGRGRTNGLCSMYAKAVVARSEIRMVMETTRDHQNDANVSKSLPNFPPCVERRLRCVTQERVAFQEKTRGDEQ